MLSTQYQALIGSLGGGRSARFRPLLWFEDDFPQMNGQALAPQNFQTTKKISFDGPGWGVQVECRFHVRVALGGVLPAQAVILNDEFPLGFIDQFKVTGASSRFQKSGDIQRVNASSLFRMLNMWKVSVPTSVRVSRNGGAYQQVLDQGPDFGSNGPGQVAAPTNTINTNTDYDVIVTYVIPLVPIGVREWKSFCYDPNDWSDLRVQTYVNDASGLFDQSNQANVTITFGALQGNANVGGTAAASGAPLIRFSLIELSVADKSNAAAAVKQHAIGTKLLIRTFQSLSQPLQSVNGNVILARLTTQNLPYLRYILKTGNSPAQNPTNGVTSVINNLNDSEIIFANPQRKTTAIRTYKDMDSVRDFFQMVHGAPMYKGYMMEDFCASGSLRDAFDTTGLTSDDFTILASIAQGTGALGTQIGELIEERVMVAA